MNDFFEIFKPCQVCPSDGLMPWKWQFCLVVAEVNRQYLATCNPPSNGERRGKASVHTIVEVNDNCLLNQPVQALDESLVCRIRLDVVISILNRTELGHKSMGNTILLRSIFFVSSDV